MHLDLFPRCDLVDHHKSNGSFDPRSLFRHDKTAKAKNQSEVVMESKDQVEGLLGHIWTATHKTSSRSEGARVVAFAPAGKICAAARADSTKGWTDRHLFLPSRRQETATSTRAEL
jgi:hypothetical protein